MAIVFSKSIKITSVKEIDKRFFSFEGVKIHVINKTPTFFKEVFKERERWAVTSVLRSTVVSPNSRISNWFQKKNCELGD